MIRVLVGLAITAAALAATALRPVSAECRAERAADAWLSRHEQSATPRASAVTSVDGCHATVEVRDSGGTIVERLEEQLDDSGEWRVVSATHP
jgi:hypothetical protein